MSDPGREQEHISVVARLRPSPQPSPHVRAAEKEVVVQIPRGDDVINNQVEEYGFRFARVFGPDASQRTVFDAAAKELVLGALDGVNCTIFAYGQTGSGKTYTICGNHKERGIVPRSLNAIFEALERRQGGEDFSISMSFIEVYKEVGYDLLAKERNRPHTSPRKGFKNRELTLQLLLPPLSSAFVFLIYNPWE
ncbi:KIF6 [Symbiodinium natans]|uniref:KIF6 protein n=1 Tax=Symbiodinium natans TaxID=878477 RepID=A0A812V1V4_9DINO|nr:KIF6 [Symbiodinium natans]